MAKKELEAPIFAAAMAEVVVTATAGAEAATVGAAASAGLDPRRCASTWPSANRFGDYM